jgi:hypothetical protein
LRDRGGALAAALRCIFPAGEIIAKILLTVAADQLICTPARETGRVAGNEKIDMGLKKSVDDPKRDARLTSPLIPGLAERRVVLKASGTSS